MKNGHDLRLDLLFSFLLLAVVFLFWMVYWYVAVHIPRVRYKAKKLADERKAHIDKVVREIRAIAGEKVARLRHGDSETFFYPILGEAQGAYRLWARVKAYDDRTFVSLECVDELDRSDTVYKDILTAGLQIEGITTKFDPGVPPPTHDQFDRLEPDDPADDSQPVGQSA